MIPTTLSTKPRKNSTGSRSLTLTFARRGLILLVSALVSAHLIGCATRAPTSAQTGAKPSSAPATVAVAKPAERGQNAPTSRNAPIADKPINVAGQCSQTEEDGFREQAKLDIQANEVKALDWKLWVGKRGSCSFDGAEFSQTQRRPHIEMLAKDGSQCKLMIWQTPERVTLAHANCQKRCTPGIYDDAWPVMFHPKTGVCARLG